MKTCEYLTFDNNTCDNACEGNTDFCSTHNRLLRKQAENERKESEKRSLKFSTPKPKRTRINQVSAKRKVLNVEYAQLKERYLSKHPECQAKLIGCEFKSVDVHHTESGSNKVAKLNDITTFIAVCRHCHHLIHNVLSSSEARELKLKI